MNKIYLCNLCNENSWVTKYKTYDRMLNIFEEFILNECKNCGLKTYFPRLSQTQLKKHYPENDYYSYQDIPVGFFGKLRAYLVSTVYQPTYKSKLVQFLINDVPAIPKQVINGKILDIGCGSGQTLLQLKMLGWKCYGLEIDNKAVTRARSKGLHNVYLGGYEEIMRFPDNYFDAIRLYHVIEHLEDPDHAINLIRKKLKDDGELLIGTPNIDSVVAKLFNKYWYNLDIPRHIWLFSPNTLPKLLIKNGFSPGIVKYYSGAGIAGSIQYLLNDNFKCKLNLVDLLPIILLFYPIEWFLDKIKLGDIMVYRAVKS